MDVPSVLADVAGLGPYFSVGTGPAADDERPVADLHRDPQPLRERIAHVRGALGGDERVAASLAFQGLAAQLVSPPYAAAVLHGVVPALTPADLRWRRTADGGWALRSGTTRCVPELAPLLDDLLGPLVAAVRAQVPVSERLLWGNAASTVAAAKRLVTVQRPASAARAAEVARAVLTAGPLAGAGEFLPARAPDRVWTFRRRSCCLYYRVPGGGLCGDCVLGDGPASPAARPPR
ncbi:(2Fe-2S)-binding protein [Pseudonocardia kunmingensis]|uniref:(2Fe-2S)-binding protein n=1 Tax=Pseudonocardia kunmingensis TaxID=630975 RepID=UPI001478DD2D|nr:(2Fe-2S)-binding protein [Pseudonocardia kunmingensis]